MTTDRTLVTRLLVRTAAQLEQLRRERHAKRYGLALEAKVSAGTLRNILKGKDHHVSKLVQIADSLDCDVVIEIKPRDKIA